MQYLTCMFVSDKSGFWNDFMSSFPIMLLALYLNSCVLIFAFRQVLCLFVSRYCYYCLCTRCSATTILAHACTQISSLIFILTSFDAHTEDSHHDNVHVMAPNMGNFNAMIC
jgi:hypothetical protein